MRNKKVHITIIIIFIIIIGVSLYYILEKPINLGLDLRGGTQIILRPTETGGGEVISEKLEAAIDIIRDRIDSLGVSEPLITKDLSNNIVIQLPGVKDPERAEEIIGKTAELEFRLVTGTFISTKDQTWNLVKFDAEKGELIIDPNAEEVLLVDDINDFINGNPYKIAGELVDDPESEEKLLVEFTEEDSQEEDTDAAAGYATNGEIRVALSFKDEGVEIFKQITTDNIGRNLAIVLDEEVKSAPYIRVPIPDGNAEITGINSLEEAKNIEIVLQFGALPVNLKIEESSTVGPKLGMESLNGGPC